MKPKILLFFPTDTVYGEGAKLYDKKDSNCISQIKKRPLKKVLLFCASLQQAKNWSNFSPKKP
ncbi:Sua5/YciO/YrdC/YwlC family protein [Areca yellow leaf disease phytoplasma]|uniref:Sua5/YciO/YrdC/YwlC family protein n=1 Tax=Areca yellow leaf disease phytoplasma TaxID=927614 RepID=UPI0035B559D7